MYQIRKSKALVRLFAFTSAVAMFSSTFYMPCGAEPSRLTTAHHNSAEDLAFVSKTFDHLPAKKDLKTQPDDVEIYELNSAPLRDRTPFLLVHGLRGEHYSYFRWQKVVDHLTRSSAFKSRYKVYFARYSTKERLDRTVPKFRMALDRLYKASKKRPITMFALSMGGNVAYESMLDPETAAKVNVLFALGTPFHGSPLFSEDWMQYSLYKKLAWPWTRIDHALAIRLYFKRNQNLLADLSWDGVDNSVPAPGKFRSRLPLGPKGNLTEADTVNERLAEINDKSKDLKKKLIAYSGYLHNPYLDNGKAARYIESAAMYPVTLVSMRLPAHLAREHPVLEMLNRDIASTYVNDVWQKKAQKSPFIYALNDGITPVSSALFLPREFLVETPMANTTDIEKVKGNTDVRLARVFKNIDHLTYIDGFRPFGASEKIRDDLNPSEGEKEIFQWMLEDILNTNDVAAHIAETEVKGEKVKVSD